MTSSFKEPILIVGAPRSGTSLLLKILREHDGFRSVAKESQFIWEPWTHPARHEWQYEGWISGKLSQAEILKIRSAFDRYTMSSRFWRRTNVNRMFGYRRTPAFAPLFRLAYDIFSRVNQISAAFTGSNEDSTARLVDKSTSYGLFLPLAEQVFPDAKYLHIVREGTDTVRSMAESWLNPERFFSFRLPGGLAIPDYPHELWNFGLPAGWPGMRSSYLAEVAAFQWAQLQTGILENLEVRPKSNVLRIRLEDLHMDPESELRRIASFADLPWSSYFDCLASNLPRVNARPLQKEGQELKSNAIARMRRLSKYWRDRIKAINRRLGYS